MRNSPSSRASAANRPPCRRTSRRWPTSCAGAAKRVRVFVEERVARYIVALVRATRAPHAYVERGASPRATLALAAMARARALCDGRTFALPDDVRAAAAPVLRHRLAFNYRTVAEGIDAETIVAELDRGRARPMTRPESRARARNARPMLRRFALACAATFIVARRGARGDAHAVTRRRRRSSIRARQTRLARTNRRPLRALRCARPVLARRSRVR